MGKKQHLTFEESIGRPEILRHLMKAFNNFRVVVDFELFTEYGIGNGAELITEFCRRILVDGERFYGNHNTRQ